MNTVQETSLNAYYTEIKPTLGVRQQLVLEEISKHKDITNSEIASYLNIPINTVTPRCKELRKLGYVREAGKRICKITGRNVLAWEKVMYTLF